MLMRSGKIRFLFWNACFAVFVYVWIVILGLQALLSHTHPSSELAVGIVVLYLLLIASVLAGTIVATLIGNRFYSTFYGIAVFVTFGTLMAVKSLRG